MRRLFDRYYKKYDAWYSRNKFAYLSEVEALKNILPQKGKGLEIGVGTGRFAQALSIGYGIDPSGKMLEIARKRGVNVKLGWGEQLPFEACTFDYAAIIITLCFVKYAFGVLRQAGRVLKKNGKLIVGIIDKDSFLAKFYQKKKSVFYKQANFFSVKELISLVKAAGFRKFTYYQTIFRLPARISSIEKPKRGYGKGGFVVIGAQKS